MPKLTLPAPPYPLRRGMQWDMDKDCIFIFDNGKPVMVISISEVMCGLHAIKKPSTKDSND